MFVRCLPPLILNAIHSHRLIFYHRLPLETTPGHPRACQARDACLLERGAARFLGPGLGRRWAGHENAARVRTAHRARPSFAAQGSFRVTRAEGTGALVVSRGRRG